MSAHAKFMFDTVFGDGEQASLRAKPIYTADDLAAARQAARAEGVLEGRRQGQAEAAAGTDKRLGELVDQVRALTGRLAEERELIAAEAMQLAQVGAELLAAALVARQPQAELTALFEECIAHLSAAPHVAVRVPPGDVEELRARLARIAETKGYEGRIIVLAESDMDVGDCRIEWADGGIARDGRKLRDTLRRLVASRFPPDWPASPSPDDDEVTDLESVDVPRALPDAAPGEQQ